MKLSIVTTLYDSEPYMHEFYRRACDAARALTYDYEVIFVNDGSPDDSLSQAIRLCEQDPRVKLVDLSRNFGHHRALMTGLGYASGDLVFVVDCDLEEPPELLGDYYAAMQEAGCDVVVGTQERRQGGGFERISGESVLPGIQFVLGPSDPRECPHLQAHDPGIGKIFSEVKQRPVIVRRLYNIPSDDES